MKDYKEIISKKLEEKDIGLSSEEIYKLIEIPPQEKMGDYSFPCFQLAKTLRKNPALIATEMASALELEDFAEIKNVGPYINFFLDRKKFENEVINTIIEKKRKLRQIRHWQRENCNCRIFFCKYCQAISYRSHKVHCNRRCS